MLKMLSNGVFSTTICCGKTTQMSIEECILKKRILQFAICHSICDGLATHPGCTPPLAPSVLGIGTSLCPMQLSGHLLKIHSVFFSDNVA